MLAFGSFTLLISFQALHSFRNTHSLRFLTLHSAFVHFTHLSTPRHKWLSHSTPQSTLSFHFVQRLLIHARRKPCKLCKICNLPPTKSIQGSSIPYPPIEPFHSVTTNALFQRISNGLFFPLRRVHPIKRLSGRAVSLLHLIGECLGYRQYKKPQKTPPPNSCAENKYISC